MFKFKKGRFCYHPKIGVNKAKAAKLSSIPVQILFFYVNGAFFYQKKFADK